MESDIVVDTDLPKKVFAELGFPGFRPLRDLLVIRTDPVPVRAGLIFKPQKLQTFYGELPHMQPVTGTVIAIGRKVTDAKVGDHVAFMRLHFARWDRLEDGNYVGWIKEQDVFGWADLDPEDTFADLRVDSGRR